MIDRATGRAAWWLAIVFAVLLAAPGAAHDPPRTTVTWVGDIARLVQSRCTRCHSPDGKGPMSLVTYEDARPWARAIREEVLARRMPKWHAARGYGAFANDPTLSPFDIALIVAWVDGGAVRGDRSKAAQQAVPIEPTTPRSSKARTIALSCGDRPLPPGRLLAIKPSLAEGASAGFSVILPGGHQEIVAWIRDYEADFAETYWLESPIVLPRGSRLLVEGDSPCRVDLKIEAARSAGPEGPALQGLQGRAAEGAALQGLQGRAAEGAALQGLQGRAAEGAALQGRAARTP